MIDGSLVIGLVIFVYIIGVAQGLLWGNALWR